MKKNVMIIGAGGVSNVVAHKCAQHNDVLGNIVIASRTKSKCDKIINSIERKGSKKYQAYSITAYHLDAMDIPATEKLIKQTATAIVINVGTAFINMSVLQACINTGTAYMDTAIHEEPDKICENPPWYANYEWKRLGECRKKGITAILGVGFDPGVVNAYAAYADRYIFDTIDTIDIMDVNAGCHGEYFATNFDPEINFREFTGGVWTYIDRQWIKKQMFEVKQVYNFPGVGEMPIYLNGHDEIHSLSKNIDANSIRFWMGFGDHYINVFTVLKNIGLLSEQPVTTAEDLTVVPLKVVKACLPDPVSLAAQYTGKTCIADLVKGRINGDNEEVLLYNICDHKACYEEVESQAIAYTAGVPPAAAAMLIATGEWDCKEMKNVEELDPAPFLKILNQIGLPTRIIKDGEDQPLSL
ncbi:saccharopine dehydrogenase family protein [Desulfobacter sp.]|uniref:saccharopine dehydrogenase family protein n=1 Tax=Desulfobacter sp. TaxID=2294 RepID=UPI003D0CBF99